MDSKKNKEELEKLIKEMNEEIKRIIHANKENDKLWGTGYNNSPAYEEIDTEDFYDVKTDLKK